MTLNTENLLEHKDHGLLWFIRILLGVLLFTQILVEFGQKFSQQTNGGWKSIRKNINVLIIQKLHKEFLAKFIM